MAFASGGTVGTANSTTSGPTLALTPDALATLGVGEIGVLTIGVNNQSSTDGNTSEIASVTDTGGNTWTNLREFCNSQGAADAGVTVSVWVTKATGALTVLDTVTITLANTKTSKAASLWKFTVAAGSTVQVASGGAGDLATDGGDAGSIALADLPSKEYLFFRGEAGENNGASYTPTANYTAITQAIADTGNNNTSMTAQGEFRILTGTGDTTDPDTVNNRDWASTMLALEEVAAGGTTLTVDDSLHMADIYLRHQHALREESDNLSDAAAKALHKTIDEDAAASDDAAVATLKFLLALDQADLEDLLSKAIQSVKTDDAAFTDEFMRQQQAGHEDDQAHADALSKSAHAVKDDDAGVSDAPVLQTIRQILSLDSAELEDAVAKALLAMRDDDTITSEALEKALHAVKSEDEGLSDDILTEVIGGLLLLIDDALSADDDLRKEIRATLADGSDPVVDSIVTQITGLVTLLVDESMDAADEALRHILAVHGDDQGVSDSADRLTTIQAVVSDSLDLSDEAVRAVSLLFGDDAALTEAVAKAVLKTVDGETASLTDAVVSEVSQAVAATGVVHTMIARIAERPRLSSEVRGTRS